MNQKTAIITGSNGGIGAAICEHFLGTGWSVIATDLHENARGPCSDYLPIDLSEFVRNQPFRTEQLASLKAVLDGRGLDALINNAALQTVEAFESVTSDGLMKTFEVNTFAPYLLTQGLIEELAQNRGAMLNIGSVHARVTKPGFSAYASSKAALRGVTQSLAVELGARIRVMAIEPAAIETPMLLDGINHNDSVLARLAACHPSNSLGSVRDVAKTVAFMCDTQSSFLNGAIIGLNGGIAFKLVDPVD